METVQCLTSHKNGLFSGVAPKDVDKISKLKEFMAKQHAGSEALRRTSSTPVLNCDEPSVGKYALLPDIWEVILLKLTVTNDLKNVSLVCCLFRNIVIGRLWNSPKLKQGITPEDLNFLKHLPIKYLNGLDIGGGERNRRDAYTVKLVDALCSFPQLTSLKLGWNINLNYWMIGRISRTKTLRSLSFQSFYGGCATAFKQLESLQLEALYIEESVMDSDVEPVLKTISKMKTLRILEIHTTDSTCKYLTRLPNLEELTINWADLTQAGYKVLSTIKTLKKLKFDYCYDVSEHIEIIKKAQPNLIIEIAEERNAQQEMEDASEQAERMAEAYGSDYDPSDYDESDLPSDFFDTYSELHMDDSISKSLEAIGGGKVAPYDVLQHLQRQNR